MKRLLILVAVAIVTIGILAGCAGEVKTHTDPERGIAISKGEQFVIALDSNPTTGYSWQAAGYNENLLKLVKSTYEMSEEAKQGVVGVGGIEYFRFKALGTGQTWINMSYKRPWEEETLDLKVFAVYIE